MIHSQKEKAEIFRWSQYEEEQLFEKFRFHAASKLCKCHQHIATSGSVYITIGDDIKLRFADHVQISVHHRSPNYNFVNRFPTGKELSEISKQIVYPRICKQTAFALHTELTVPKLKKLLSNDCYEYVCENEFYSNTYTRFIVIENALDSLTRQGCTKRLPVRQELYTLEDC